MRLFARSPPSPAMVVSVVALSAALAGSAVAGTSAVTSGLGKSQVKKIAKKQAEKVLNQKAGGLSVLDARVCEPQRRSRIVADLDTSELGRVFAHPALA